MLLCGSVLVAPLLFPKSSTTAETRVSFTRADAVRELEPARATAAGTSGLLLASFLATTTTEVVAKPRSATTARAQRTTTTTRRSQARARSTTTTKPKAASKPAATTAAMPPPGPPSATGKSQTGQASWYDAAPPGTCAHRTLPKGLVITVTHLADQKQVTCRVADRGPYIDGRIIDLSRSGFEALAPARAGVINVRIDW